MIYSCWSWGDYWILNFNDHHLSILHCPSFQQSLVYFFFWKNGWRGKSISLFCECMLVISSHLLMRNLLCSKESNYCQKRSNSLSKISSKWMDLQGFNFYCIVWRLCFESYLKMIFDIIEIKWEDWNLNNLWFDWYVRSAHSNAYFFGFGSNKRIVIYDTLMKQANEDEIEAIVAHELGYLIWLIILWESLNKDHQNF